MPVLKCHMLSIASPYSGILRVNRRSIYFMVEYPNVLVRHTQSSRDLA